MRNKSAAMKKPIAVVPIAIPITIGPGGISTVIIYSSAAKNYSDIALIIISGFLVSLICYLILSLPDASANAWARPA